MKALTFLLIVFCTLNVYSQGYATDPYLVEGKITFHEVKYVQTAAKEDLYFGTLSWINSSFNDAKDVIVTSDREGGRILAKGSFLVHENRLYSGRAVFTMLFEFKDGRYRYTYSDFIYVLNQPNNFVEQPFEDGKPKNVWKGWWEDAHQSIVDKMMFLPDELHHYLELNEKDPDW